MALQTTSNLTELGTKALVEGIRTRAVSAREVVEAHIRRIEEINPRLNAVVSPRFELALIEADAIDARVAAGGSLGPLVGIPITVKECHGLAGTPFTAGLGNRVGLNATQDNVLVSRLKQAGAIVVGKGNLPQLMISVECENPVYGRTNNPWDLGRSPGGSSGGDAAVVAARGATLALGGDIGGSLRIPAHVCGLATLKPTAYRMSTVGSFDPIGRQESIPSQAGPLARTVEDVALAFEILAAPGLDRVDPAVPPVPWTSPDEVRVRQLRIGYFEDDGFFCPAPALRRVVREAAEALTRMGAHVEPWTPLGVEEGIWLFFALLSADGARGIGRIAGESARDFRVEKLEAVARLPAWIRPALMRLLEFRGQRKVMPMVSGIRPFTVDAYWSLLEQKKRFVLRVVSDLQAKGLDAIVCPPSPLPALLHGSSAELGPVYCYTTYFNVLGFPAGVIPASTVGADEQSDRPTSRDRVLEKAKQVEKGSLGLPVGVQVAAPLWREDRVLAIMAALESHFRLQPGYPSRPKI